MSKKETAIESLLKEGRTFYRSKKFRENAHVNSESVYRRAKSNREKFWEDFANELDWFKKWRKVLTWKAPYAKWFVGGKINLSYNCLDRHITTHRKNKAAIIWESESGESITLTYWELYREVNKFAHVLKRLGVKKGDRVTIYMPMIPELAIAMLACARVGNN